MEATTSLMLEQARKMSNPELRRAWDYERGDKATAAVALDVLRDRGQVGPDGRPYAFGTVVAQHTVGPYTIIESKQDENHHGPIPGKEGEYGEVTPEMAPEHSFSSYAEGVRTGHSYGSLDDALIHAIAYRNLGNPNSASWATTHVAKILELR